MSQKVLRREYASFFNPMERGSYTPDVEFIDPMISIRGDWTERQIDIAITCIHVRFKIGRAHV